jgi:hypothetical protein
MKHRAIARVIVMKMPRLHPEAIRVEIDCRYSTTGLTSFPGPVFALTRGQLITSAVFEHEARCGRCSTDHAHQQGDRQIREMTDRAWKDLLDAAGRRYAEARKN